jgi:hypothetical protein
MCRLSLNHAWIYCLLMSGLRPSEADVLLAARSMIEHYGRDAAMEAARRSDLDLASGDRKGSATWKRIMVAIEKLQGEQPETVQ